MLKFNVKKVIICLIAMVFIMLMANKSFASSNGDIFNKLNNLDDTNSEQIQSGNRASNTDVEDNNTNTNTNTNINTNTNTNENKPKETPYTGLSDGSTVVFIAIFIGTAVYGAIKVKKYNV